MFKCAGNEIGSDFVVMKLNCVCVCGIQLEKVTT